MQGQLNDYEIIMNYAMPHYHENIVYIYDSLSCMISLGQHEIHHYH